MTTKKTNNTKNLAAGVRTAVGLRFRGQTPRIWFVFAGKHCKALVINTTTKKVLMEAGAVGGQLEALDALRKKVSPSVKPTRGARG